MNHSNPHPHDPDDRTGQPSPTEDPIRKARDEVDRPGVARAGTGGLEQPGDVLGRYRLIQQLGEGGFGTVWMAEQTEPVSRKVAIKLIRRDIASKEVLARFESECQALAILNHPQIAKVFDAGVTDNGRPYFVMEYVPGIPITEYCDLRGLGLAARLELFIQACEAIEHAHRKGILHRDVKPSNLLVAATDGKPALKVIDFGVAKATSQRLTERTLFTEHGILVGTPEYMSPEQAGSTPLEVDRRSDVYSLGVLLYELLVGVLPFDTKVLRNAALIEFLRIVREEEPPTPSARVVGLGAEAEKVAKQRHLDARALARELRGDLEWITMRALEKDPGRRYASAESLARDVERYLAREPVEAGPPSLGYRLRKLAQRRRAALVGGGAVAMLSTAFVAALALQSQHFDRQRQDSAAGAQEALATAAPARRLILDEAGDYNAALPTADGRHLLRYDTEERGYELLDLESRATEHLTRQGPDPAQYYFVSHALAPDKSRIAAILWLAGDKGGPSSGETDGGRELRVFEVGESGEGNVLDSWGPGHHVQVFAWSPDKSLVWLFVIRPDRGAEILAIDPGSGERNLVREIPRRTHTQVPSLSPDGRHLAFHDDGDLYLLAADGSTEFAVGHAASDSRPLFTPDGSGIVFVSDRRSGAKDLWYLPVYEGRPAGDARIVWGDLGILGTAMEFADNGSYFYFFATNGWEIRTLALDASERTRSATEVLDMPRGTNGTAPAYSPDGKHLAFLRDGKRLVVRELQGGREREYSLPRPGMSTLDWRRDGAEVVVSSFGDEATCFVVDLVRGGAETLPLEWAWNVQFLGDGEDLVFLQALEAGDMTAARLVRLDATGDETELYRGSLDQLRASPDGSRLALIDKGDTDARVVVLPSAGGETVTVAASPLHERPGWRWPEFQGLMWTPDGQSLLIVHGERGGEAELRLWRHALDGTQPEDRGGIPVPRSESAHLDTFHYSLHPDGDRITFQRHVGFLSQIWAIDRLDGFIRSGESLPLSSPQR